MKNAEWNGKGSAERMRLIDADALIKNLDDAIQDAKRKNEICDYWEDDRSNLLYYLDNAPTIDAVEVVRGEWIDKPTKGVRYICSRCRGRFDYQWKYCPNCGARMKGADDDNND